MITIVILTKNEESNITDVIKNAHKVSDEILLCNTLVPNGYYTLTQMNALSMSLQQSLKERCNLLKKRCIDLLE